MSTSLVELEAIREATSALEPLDADGRRRAVTWIADALGVSDILPSTQTPALGSGVAQEPLDSVKDLSPKQFMALKRPTTAVERVTCLGFYLSYGRETPHFKTGDLAALNQEAAGPPFSNISQAGKDAVKAQYLAPAGGGSRQLTALGEEVVKALPDREKVKETVASARPVRRRRPRKKTLGGSSS